MRQNSFFNAGYNVGRFWWGMWLLVQLSLCLCSSVRAEVQRQRTAIKPLPNLTSLPEIEQAAKIPIEGTLIYDVNTETEDGDGSVIVFQTLAPQIEFDSHLKIFMPRGYLGMTAIQASPDGQHVLLKTGRIINEADRLTYFVWHKNNPAPYKSHRLPPNLEYRYGPQSPLGEIYNRPLA